MGEPDELRLGKHRGLYCVLIGKGDGRRRRSLGTDDAIKAATAFAEFEQQWKRLNRPKNGTISQIIDAYIKDRRAEGKDAERIENAWKKLKPTFGALLPRHVTKEICRAYAKGRKARNGTIHTELTYLRAALKWAVKTEWIEQAPHVWMPEKSPPRDRFLTRDEAKRLIDAAKMPHVKLFIILALNTAGRAGALLQLKWDRVDLPGRRLDLHDPDTPRTNKGRAVVPINDSLHAALVDAQKGAQTDYVIEWAGEPVKSVKKGFATAVTGAKIRKCSPHDLRRTAARWMAEGGVSITEIAQFLGHEDDRITQKVYSRYSPEHLRRAATALEM